MGPALAIVWTALLCMSGICAESDEEWKDIGDVLQPVVELDLPDAMAYIGKLFLYPLPSILHGKATSVQVVEAGKDSLPGWLYFNDSCNTLQGLPTLSDHGPVYIGVYFTRSEIDDTPAIIFQITVKALPAIFNPKTVKQLNYISNNIVHLGSTEEFMAHKLFTCEPYEITYVATLQLNVDMKDLSAEIRINIIKRYAQFVSRNVVDLTVVTSSVLTKRGYAEVLAAGPGNAHIDESLHKTGVDLTWTIACGTFSEIQNFVRVVEHNIKSNRIPDEIGYDIIGWRIESYKPVTELRQSRHHLRHIRAAQTPIPTPLFTASSVPSTVTISLSEESRTILPSTMIESGKPQTVISTADQVQTQVSTVPPESSSTVDLSASETVSILTNAVQTMISESIHVASTPVELSAFSTELGSSSSSFLASSSLLSTSIESSQQIQSSTSTPPLSTTSLIEPSLTSEPVSSTLFLQSSISMESSYVDVFSSPLTTVVGSVSEVSTSFVSKSLLTEPLDSTIVQSVEASMSSFTIQRTELESFSSSIMVSSMSFDQRTTLTSTVDFMSSSLVQPLPSYMTSFMSAYSDNILSPTTHDLPVSSSTVLQSEHFTTLPTDSSVSLVPTLPLDSTAIFTTSLSSPAVDLTSLISSVPSIVTSSIVENISSISLPKSSLSSVLSLTTSSLLVRSSLFPAFESTLVSIEPSSSSLVSSVDLVMSTSVVDSTSVLPVGSSVVDKTSVFSLLTSLSLVPDVTSTAISSSSFTSSFATSYEPTSTIISSLISDTTALTPPLVLPSSSISTSVVSLTVTEASSTFLPSSSDYFASSFSLVSSLSYESTTMFISTSLPISSSLMLVSSFSQLSSFGLSTMFVSSSTPLLSSLVLSSSNNFTSSTLISPTTSADILSSLASTIPSEVILPSSTDWLTSSSFLSPSSSQLIFTTSIVSPASSMSSSMVDVIVSSSEVGPSSSINIVPSTSAGLPVSTSQPVLTTSVTPDHPPVLYNPIDILHVKLGEYFTYKIPSDTFHDFEDGDTNNLNLQLQPLDSNTYSLRNWVKLNTSTNIIYGLAIMNDLMPYSGTRVRVEFVLTAQDSSGLVARDALYIEIDTTNIYTLSFIFYATFDIDYTTFIKDVDILIQLLDDIGAFYGDDNLDFITVYDIAGGSVELAWSNNSISSQYCDNTTIRTLYEKLIQTDKGSQMEIPSQIFQTAMQPRKVVSVNYTLEGVCQGVGIGLSPPRPTVIVGLATQTDYNIWLSTVLPAVLIAVLLFLIGLILFIFFRYRRRNEHMKPEDKVTFVKNRKPLFLPQEVEMHESPSKPARSTVLDRDLRDPSVKRSDPSSSQPLPPEYKLPRDVIFQDIFGPVSSPPPSYHSGNSTPTRSPPKYKLPPPYQAKMNSSDV